MVLTVRNTLQYPVTIDEKLAFVDKLLLDFNWEPKGVGDMTGVILQEIRKDIEFANTQRNKAAQDSKDYGTTGIHVDL